MAGFGVLSDWVNCWWSWKAIEMMMKEAELADCLAVNGSCAQELRLLKGKKKKKTVD